MNTLAEIRAILAGCTAPDVPVESITAEASLASLGIDSLDRVEAVMSIENKFGIEIGNDEAKACERVADLVTLVEAKSFDAYVRKLWSQVKAAFPARTISLYDVLEGLKRAGVGEGLIDGVCEAFGKLPQVETNDDMDYTDLSIPAAS